MVSRKATFWALALSLSLSHCMADGGPAGSGVDASTSSDGGVPPMDDAGTPPEHPFPESQKARVKQKRPEVLARDFANALELDQAELCAELGSFGCFGVHKIALGGVEPYALGLYEPFPHSTVTTPLVLDRIGLAACAARAARDFAAPDQAIVFGALATAAPASKDDPSIAAAITALYQRFLKRNPTAEEIGYVSELFEGDSKSFAILSCFAISTSVEHIFY